MTETAAHPLLARLPEPFGYIVQIIPVGAGLVIVEATPGSDFGDYEVTGYRPLPAWQIEAEQDEFPGETGLPTVDYVSTRTLHDVASVEAAITEQRDALVARLERDAAKEAA